MALGSAALGPRLLAQRVASAGEKGDRRTAPVGPASKYVPTIKATFVRRKEDCGILWPGAIYDGEAALRKYRQQIEAAGKQLGVRIDLRSGIHHQYGAASGEGGRFHLLDRRFPAGRVRFEDAQGRGEAPGDAVHRAPGRRTQGCRAETLWHQTALHPG
jgi:hypothetical protein